MDKDVKERPPAAEISAFLENFSLVSDPHKRKTFGHGFLSRFPPEHRLELASLMTWANPFFLPDIPDEAARKLSLDRSQFNELVMRAKLTAQRSSQLNLMLACAPKSASTFIETALRKALDLPTASLFTNTMSGLAASMLGANLREQQPDELALLRNGLNGTGYVAQHHSRCTPYLAQLLALYNVRPIVTHRNLFDTFVSLDDMVMAYRTGTAEDTKHYFNDALPANYGALDLEQRLTLLVHRNTTWYIQFYLSWKKCERAGLIRPLWISYEDDFLGDKAVLAEKVRCYLGPDAVDAAKLADAFADKRDAKARRFNQGIAGRGRDIPYSVRKIVLQIASYYEDEEDLTPLIGD